MEERRRYFRLDDEVVMDFQAISQEEFQHWKESQSLEKNELRELEQELGTLLHQMRSVHPSLAQILELYNRKINLLSGHKDDSSGAPMSGTGTTRHCSSSSTSTMSASERISHDGYGNEQRYSNPWCIAYELCYCI